MKILLEFDHITTLPNHSQSNGKAESVVKIAQLMLKKVSKDQGDIHLAILTWRNTTTEIVPCMMSDLSVLNILIRAY